MPAVPADGSPPSCAAPFPPTGGRGMVTGTARDELDQILGDGALHTVYQPIVQLSTGQVVAFEALVRGPEGSVLEQPDLLFAAARAAGRLPELDWACRAAALRGALAAGMGRAPSLFVNIEPEVAGATPASLHDLLQEAGRTLEIVVEVTERALVSDPAALLTMLRRVRGRGWGVALDDVGSEVASLALMPFLAPDVVKLDLRLVQQRPDDVIASIVGAVAAHVERTGTTVLAEGIETPTHLDTALTLGATLGQGWLFARPGPLPPDVGALQEGVWRPSHPPPGPRRSAMEAVDAGDVGVALRRSTKPLLVAMSKHLEHQALEQGEATVVLSTFQTARRFEPDSQTRYAEMAQQAVFVGVLGIGMSDQPAPGVRGGALEIDDSLVREWTITVVGPHFAAALVAIDLGDEGPEAQRRFDYVLTYDRRRALAVAAELMARMPGRPAGRPAAVTAEGARPGA